MHFSNPLIVCTLTAVTTASVAPKGYHWSVIHWKASCTTSTCNYNFNITGPETSFFPGFKAQCSGSDTGSLQACKILKATTTNSTISEVAARLAPVKNPEPATTAHAKLAVQLMFQNDGSEFTYTGFKKTAFDPMVIGGIAFPVTPSKASAVGK